MESSLDINECKQGNGGCEHTCTNTIGSYYCTCNSGYKLSKEKHCSGNKIIKNKLIYIVHSSDINECNTNNGNCAQICTNVEGSHLCSCHDGYTLHTNGRSCTGIY